MPNMDDTLDVEDIVFLITLNHKTILCKSPSHEDDFSSRRAVANEFLSRVTFHGHLRMRTMTTETSELV